MGERMQDGRFSHVQMTRHKEKLELFIDQETAGKDFENIIARMEKKKEILLATEVQKRNEQSRDGERIPVKVERQPGNELVRGRTF